MTHRRGFLKTCLPEADGCARSFPCPTAGCVADLAQARTALLRLVLPHNAPTTTPMPHPGPSPKVLWELRALANISGRI